MYRIIIYRHKNTSQVSLNSPTFSFFSCPFEQKHTFTGMKKNFSLKRVVVRYFISVRICSTDQTNISRSKLSSSSACAPCFSRIFSLRRWFLGNRWRFRHQEVFGDVKCIPTDRPDWPVDCRQWQCRYSGRSNWKDKKRSSTKKFLKNNRIS